MSANSCISDLHKGQSSKAEDDVHLSDMYTSNPNSVTTVGQRQQTTSIYFPLPYATTHINNNLEDKENNINIRQLVDDGQYATVKRSPRLPKTDLHAYNFAGI